MVVALYDCQPDRKDELGFKEGERIVVTRKINHDWWVSSKHTTLDNTSSRPYCTLLHYLLCYNTSELFIHSNL